jgi:3-hydroxyacyl-CoA dehydrogenase
MSRPGTLVSDVTPLDGDRLLVLVDLLNIRDRDGISLPGRPGDFGLGDPFAFPYQTVESVLPLGGNDLAVVNDTNFGSTGRNPTRPDDSDFIVVKVPVCDSETRSWPGAAELGCWAMFVFKAAVVGAGVMGGEIAQVIAAAGIPVVLKDVDAKFVDAGLQKAREVTEGQSAKLVKRGKLSESDAASQTEATLSLITGTTAYDEFGDADFVIEAVPEKMEIKHAVFAELDAATPGHAILASNTSGLSITEIGDATNRPDKVVGFHFFWPASYMRLIEVIEGEDTSPETAQAAANFAQAIRKTPVRCSECPGFVVNRILVSTASEIWRYQDETGIDVEQLDQFITERAQMPMGPFRVADMSGLDTVVKVAQDMREAYGDRFYVHRGMEERLERGELGAKTGKGFYEHS